MNWSMNIHRLSLILIQKIFAITKVPVLNISFSRVFCESACSAVSVFSKCRPDMAGTAPVETRERDSSVRCHLTLLLPFSPKGENYNRHFKSIFLSSNPCPSVRIKGTLFTPRSRPLQGKKLHCLATKNPVSTAVLV